MGKRNNKNESSTLLRELSNTEETMLARKENGTKDLGLIGLKIIS